MDSPFKNDMFCLAYKAFKNIYPDKDCECNWDANLGVSGNGEKVLGLTSFAQDGKVYVDILATINVVDAIEVFAHELAHVAVGEEENHGRKWQDAFDAIHNEFDRIGNEMFGEDCSPVEVVSGKEYVRESEEL